MTRMLLALLSFAIAGTFAASAAADEPTAHWSLRDGVLRRLFRAGDGPEERTKWQLSRISWYPFIAWEERRLGGDGTVEVWLDTPGQLRYLCCTAGSVVRMETFTKGQRIPDELRPQRRKTLWVVLPSRLVRKVLDGERILSELQYEKARLPLHPFVVAQELVKAGRTTRRIEFDAADHSVVAAVAKGRLTALDVTWKTENGAFDLPNPSAAAMPSTVAPARRPAPAKPVPRKAAPKAPPSLIQASACIARGEAHPALVVLKDVIAKAPRDEHARLLAGRACFLLGRYHDAQQYFDEARRLAPGWPDPVIATAEMLTFRGRGMEARTRLDALGPAADSAYGLRVRAVLCAATRDFDGALDTGSRALALEPRDTETLFVMARAAEALNRHSAARDYYRQAQQLVAATDVTSIPHTLLVHPVGDGEDRLERLVVTPGRPAPLHFCVAFLLGAMEYRLGNAPAAAAAFTQAHLARPRDEAALFDCALAVERLPGRTGEARDLYRRLVELAPRHERARQRAARLETERRSDQATPALVRYRGPSPLDTLFQSVKRHIDGTESRPSGRRAEQTAPVRDVVHLSAVDLRRTVPSRVGLTVLTLPSSTSTLPEVRLGGRGDAPVADDVTIRLTPCLTAPAEIGPDRPAWAALELSGSIVPGRSKHIEVMLGFATDTGTDQAVRCRTVVPSDGGVETSRTCSVTIEGRLIDRAARPEFTIAIAAVREDGSRSSLLDDAIRLDYVEATKAAPPAADDRRSDEG